MSSKINKKILICVGARPNLMKAASLFRERAKFPELSLQLLHTGQHYSPEMDAVFFDELKIPQPDYNLAVGSGSHATQTAQVMMRFEEVLLKNSFDLVVVIGDINSTAACALVAAKLGIPVAHLESGLRSFDKSMPEEINRLVADHLADLHLVTEASGLDSLAREGIAADKIKFVGNTMIDTLINHLEDINQSPILTELGLQPESFVTMTLHRPSNVDEAQGLLSMLKRIDGVVPSHLKVVFPAHPRTQKMLGEDIKTLGTRFIMVGPQPYFSFLALVKNAAFILTDSGGIQEETTYLKKLCFTLRPNTERPITVSMGSNYLIHDQLELIPKVLAGEFARTFEVPPLWDGKAGTRILNAFQRFLNC